MITFDEAEKIVIQTARQLTTERVSLENSMGRILAEDVFSDIDMPPFDKSAMDGFACRREDLANELEVVETIQAGYTPDKTVGPGQCARIMTGSVVPNGADCVIMKEYVKTVTEKNIRFTGKDTKDNICKKGEDVCAGDIVLNKGVCIGPEHIAVMASAGCDKPLVSKRPKVGIMATGDELVEPGSKPGPSQIRNSNSYQLTSQVAESGSIATNYGVAGDTEAAIDTLLKKVVAENDVVIVSGGVSVGDFDFVGKILKQNDFDLLFERIAIKPGRPTLFGKSERNFCFGLPGNPVSTFIIFELMVKPFLYKLMGCDYQPITFIAPLAKSISRKKADRDLWRPVALTKDGEIAAAEYHGSAHINALCGACGLICMKAGVSEIKAGEKVIVRQI